MTDLVDSPLSQMHALITGASRGIGAAIARRMADRGASVHLLARDESLLETLAEQTGGSAYIADLVDVDAASKALSAVAERIGGVPDLIVNAAGIFEVDPLSECTVDALDRQYEVNVRATFLVNRTFLSGMLKRGGGHIVNIGSVAGRKAFPWNGAYSMSKFGLRGMHEVLLEEIRGSGVRATLIEPGATDTAIWDPLNPDDDPNLPGRSQMLSPEDVAEAVEFAATRPAGVQIPFLPIERA